MSRSLVWLAASVWLLLVLMGTAVLWDYQAAPGVAANAPATWPSASRIHRVDGLPTLVLFAHPHCPCTRAAIDNLARVLTHVNGRVATEVRFLHPRDTDAGWERAELWHRAASIPGVTVASDEEGIEAKRFGVATSGQIVLYDADGRLKFAGGITLGRGHEGDTLGAHAVVDLIEVGTTDLDTTPVFGCHLFEPVRS